MKTLCDICFDKILPLVERPSRRTNTLPSPRNPTSKIISSSTDRNTVGMRCWFPHIVFKVVVQLSHRRRNSLASASQPGKHHFVMLSYNLPHPQSKYGDKTRGDRVRLRCEETHNVNPRQLPDTRIAMVPSDVPYMPLDRSKIGRLEC